MNLRSIKLKPILKSKLYRSFKPTFIFWWFTALGCAIFFSRFQHFGDGQFDKWLSLQEIVLSALAQIQICGRWHFFFKKRPLVTKSSSPPSAEISTLDTTFRPSLQYFSIESKVSQLSDLSFNSEAKTRTKSQQDLDLAFND